MVRGQHEGGISPERYPKIVMTAGVLLTLIIFTGAAVRLTQSGLGCENWPECSNERLVPAASFHGWVEFGNRLLSGVVALGTVAAVLSAYRRNPRRPDLIRWAWFLVAGVAAQVILGAVTVKIHLHPLLVSAHFLLSIVLLWNVVVLWHKSRGGPGEPTNLLAPALRTHALGLVGAATAILITGTVVTGSGPNSGDFRADRFNVDLGTAARIHSITAWAFLALLVAFAFRLHRNAEPTGPVQPVLTVAIAQGAVGYLQYFNGVPAGLVMIHVVGAVTLWLVTLRMYLGFFARPNEVGGFTPSPSTGAPIHEAIFLVNSSEASEVD